MKTAEEILAESGLMLAPGQGRVVIKIMYLYAEEYHKEKLREELIKLLQNEQVELTYGIVEIEDIVDEYLKTKP